jgi:hypothetical protein
MSDLNVKTPVILTWEFPPRVIGDMAHEVESLTLGLNKAKIAAKVVSCHESVYSYERRSNLLELYWVSNPVGTHISVITWCLTLNSEIERIVSDIFYDKKGKLDLLDVHDWHFVSAATNLRRALRVPFVFTVHSLEGQRSHGSSSALSSCIEGLEGMGVRESDLVVVKSDSLKQDIMMVHGAPSSKIVVIPQDGKDWVKEVVNAYSSIVKKER